MNPNNCFFLGMACTSIALSSISLLYFVTLNFIMPLNEFRIIRHITLFSINRTIHFNILCLDFIFVVIFALLSVICTESIIGLYSYHTSVLFKIIKWVMLLYYIWHDIYYVTNNNNNISNFSQNKLILTIKL